MTEREKRLELDAEEWQAVALSERRKRRKYQKLAKELDAYNAELQGKREARNASGVVIGVTLDPPPIVFRTEQEVRDLMERGKLPPRAMTEKDVAALLKSADAIFVWRGSARDLATDIVVGLGSKVAREIQNAIGEKIHRETK